LLAADFFVADFFGADFFDADFFVADFFGADFFDADFFADDFFFDDVFAADFFDERFGFGGTFAPARRASERPIAIACLRLFTFLCEPPLSSLPSLRSCMTFLTFACAFFPYFAMSFLRCARDGASRCHARHVRTSAAKAADRRRASKSCPAPPVERIGADAESR